VAAQIEKIHRQMAQADQSDYEHVLELDTRARQKQEEKSVLEEQWLALSEQLED
jgi:hypothetical protein